MIDSEQTIHRCVTWTRAARSEKMHRPRLEVILIALVFTSCASPKGGAVLGVRSPPLGEGSVLLDDVGVMIPNRGFAPILARGCELPCRGSFQARTSSENQERISVRLVRRSSKGSAVVSRLADFQIADIPPGPAGERLIEVALRAKKDSLSIHAVDKETGAHLKIRTILFIGD
jgi:molecular chaperone DnaK (HSP70)